MTQSNNNTSTRRSLARLRERLKEKTVEQKWRDDFHNRCMNFAKERQLQFYKNWHIGLCVNIENFAKESRCVANICGANCKRLLAKYCSYYEFVDKTCYTRAYTSNCFSLVLYSLNNYLVENSEGSDIIEDLFFINVKDIIQDIPYTRIKDFDSNYVKKLNSSPRTIFSLKQDCRGEISFLLYMPSFNNDIKIMQEFYPGTDDSASFYFSRLESTLVLNYLEIERLSKQLPTYIVSDLSLHNIVPKVTLKQLFNPLEFSNVLDAKRKEISDYVQTLDIVDISKHYILKLVRQYNRVGGNRDCDYEPYLSIEVSMDDRRDAYISMHLPQYISVDKYLKQNSSEYYPWLKQKELDNYVLQIQESIKTSFLEKYNVESHISYLLSIFLYDLFMVEQEKVNSQIALVFRINGLRTWIAQHFLS